MTNRELQDKLKEFPDDMEVNAYNVLGEWDSEFTVRVIQTIYGKELIIND